MKLKSFSVKNYRSFAARTTIELRPLTLLFGYNSSGKSALLRTLPLLAASSRGSAHSPLSLDTELTREGSFSSLLCRSTGSKALEFGLTWASDQGPDPRIDLSIREFEGRRQYVEKFDVQTDTGKASFVLDLTSLRQKEQVYDVSMGTEGLKLPVEFHGISPMGSTPPLQSESAEKLSLMMGDVVDLLENFADQVNWLKALRQTPEREISFRTRRGRLDSDGSGATEMLVADQIDGGPIFDQVSEWFLEATNFRLNLAEGAGRHAGDRFSLMISPRDDAKTQIPIVDTGEGMSQVLPAMVLAAQAKHKHLWNEPVLALEHPELHLHPRAHEKIARIFCDTAKSDGPCLLIETHSENLLTQVQLAVAEGEIDSDRVMIYWVHQEKDGISRVQPIHLDADGEPVNFAWPAGVFSEGAELGRKLALAQRKNRRQ